MPTSLLDMPVRDAMSSSLATVDQDVAIDVAIELMHQRRIRRLPVVGGSAQQLVGMVTLDDAQKAMPADVPFYGEGQAERAEIPTVRRAMSGRVVTVGADDPVALAAQMMVRHRVGALPVLEHGAMVGIITESDIFKLVARGLPPLQQASDFV